MSAVLHYKEGQVTVFTKLVDAWAKRHRCTQERLKLLNPTRDDEMMATGYTTEFDEVLDYDDELSRRSKRAPYTLIFTAAPGDKNATREMWRIISLSFPTVKDEDKARQVAQELLDAGYPVTIDECVAFWRKNYEYSELLASSYD